MVLYLYKSLPVLATNDISPLLYFRFYDRSITSYRGTTLIFLRILVKTRSLGGYC
jgi:hypothetical protein